MLLALAGERSKSVMPKARVPRPIIQYVNLRLYGEAEKSYDQDETDDPDKPFVDL